ncbi:oxidoreductase [Clavibacter michiganensis]|nr:aldo/keto reductase [Clavibacter michiganensis]PPF65327.1 oxidoreductase [Clavibacter michiganensis]
MPTSPLVTLSDGRAIPQLGLGVYKVSDAEATDAVAHALDAGYRHIDTAAFYENERGVGQAVRASDVPRHDVFVTSKVWQSDHGYDETRRAFDASLSKLGFDYLDLYLIHWPAPRQNRYVETWRALESLKADGLVRSIGVSNFHPHHLERLAAEAGETPVINQVELHPWLQQAEVREYDAAHSIATEAWSPLARGRILDDPTLAALASKHGRSAAQVVLRWQLDLGNIVIPKSITPARIRENVDVFDFELDDDDRARIAALDSGQRTGKDPDDLG